MKEFKKEQDDPKVSLPASVEKEHNDIIAEI